MEKNVNIKITAESKEAKKGIAEVTAAINKMGKSSTLKSINSLASAVTNSISAFNTLKAAVEEVASTISECADAYAKQRSAELALEQAAKNNPYINASNVKALKNYATQLSKLSGIADEDLLPTMTKLAQAGRTEAEIMKIMGTATDVAASGVMSFEQACDALNKTFVGEMGSLKELNPQIAQMTSEQLKGGAAVEAMARAYKGTAESMGNITGGAERLANAMTSLKEEIGAAFAEPLAKMQTFFATLFEGIAETQRKSRELKDAIREAASLEELEKSGAALTVGQQRRKLEGQLSAVEAEIKEAREGIEREARSYAGTVADILSFKYQKDYEAGEMSYEWARALAETDWAKSFKSIKEGLEQAYDTDAASRGKASLAEMEARARELQGALFDLNLAEHSKTLAMKEGAAAAEESADADGRAAAMKEAYAAQVARAVEQIKAERAASLDPMDSEQAAELGKIRGLKWGEGFAVGLGQGAEGAGDALTYTLDELKSLKGTMEDALFGMVANSEGDITVKNPAFAEGAEAIREMAARIAELEGTAESGGDALAAYYEKVAEAVEKIKAARLVDPKTGEEERGRIAGLAYGEGFAVGIAEGGEEAEAALAYTLDELSALLSARQEGLARLLIKGEIGIDSEDAQKELAAIGEIAERIRELSFEEEVEIDTDEAQEKLKALRAALANAMPSPAQWRELSDTMLMFADSMEELKGKIPEAELAALEEEIKAVKEALAAPELEGWQAIEQEAKDINERIAQIEEAAKEASAAGRLDIEKAYLEEAERLNELAAKRQAEAWEEYLSQVKEKYTKLVSDITSALTQVASIISSACSTLLETSEAALEGTLAKLEIAYLKGEMGEEEYNAAVLEAKKEAAQAEYKIEMWEWAASLLTATANIAQGVTKAIAQGGVAGIVTGALVSAAGAVQLAAIIGSKPTPPTFSTGGIVGGSSYTGDRVQALLNSGEMVLNAGQQRNLFDSINSGNISKGAASGQQNVTQVQVNNNAANIVSAQPEISEGQIKLAIDARVNDSMRRGRYNKSLTQAEQLQSGKWYGS